MVINLYLFISSMVATFLGVGLAFVLDERYRRKYEKKKARRLLFLLRNEMKKNRALLVELNDELSTPGWIPFYDLNFIVWSTIPPIIVPVLKDFNIIQDIAQFYYELQHIERKLNKVFDLSFHPDFNKKTTMELRRNLIGSLNIHIPKVLMGASSKSPETLILEIEHLIKELE